MKVSFLICAHNEEKNIRNALQPIDNVKKQGLDAECIIGLDGCTDSTEKIVKEFSWVKSFKTNKRAGKTALLNDLIAKTKGEVLIVNDADWALNYDRKELEELLQVFKDKKVGGIADNVKYDEKLLFDSSKTALYLGEAWSTLFITEFRNKLYSKKHGKDFFVNYKTGGMPFYVTIWRKKAAGKQLTPADDAERMLEMLEKGFKIAVNPANNKPLFIQTTFKIDSKSLMKQKFRGFVGNKQIGTFKKGFKVSLSFYTGLMLYTLKSIPRTKSLKAAFGVILWNAITFLAFLKSLTVKDFDTRKNWSLRIKR